jgi:hypothetical protein
MRNMDKPVKAFIAYPYSPSQIRETLKETIKKAWNLKPSLTLEAWENNDIAGRCLVDPIREKIVDADFVVADISKLNFNVVYEAGFSIGRRKRIFLIRNRNLREDDLRLTREVGIFDTIGYFSYANSDDLSTYLLELKDLNPLPIQQSMPNRNAPVYLVAPREKTEAEIRLFSRVKKEARLFFRSFDPQEQGRISVREAIDSVSSSLGVILPLISSNRMDSDVHNLRCAFVAGLSHALDKETLILQAGDDPIPVDLRDVVSIYTTPQSIDRYVARFAPRITERLQESDQLELQELKAPLSKLFLGASAAENEFLDLSQYYLQTDEYQRALRGEVQIVAGRKGSGKTALFFQVRNKLRNNRQNVVVDLNPEGFQLRKLRKLILEHLEEGTREHTITAFWEYLLLLEICYKLLESDRIRHLHDHSLREQYETLSATYRNDPYVSEGDFAERLLRLTDAMEDNFQQLRTGQTTGQFLTRQQITELLYKHDLPALRTQIVDYLQHKDQVWVLFDNIDKGWIAHGVDDLDLLNLRCLVEAFSKLKWQFQRRQIAFQGVAFIRIDVYELLVESMPDRGKISKSTLDWTDLELLRELLRRRFVVSLPNKKSDFDVIWRSIAESHILGGQESSDYILKRCLMRPRALIDLLAHCRSHAINLGHERINEDDFVQGEKAYSTDLANQISLEIHDVFPSASDSLYAFIEAPRLLDSDQLRLRLERSGLPEANWADLTQLLLWYGFLGILRKTGEETYIYDVNYEMKKLKALLSTRAQRDIVYVINPSFWRGLDIDLK